mgnify:FL=1
MLRDIAIPRNNEAEFLELASKLAMKKLCFLYDFDKCNQEEIQKKIDLITNHKSITVETGFMVNQKNINKASKQSKLLIVKSSSMDRIFIESKKINLIYGFDEIQSKDYLYQRGSGLNHIICELAKKNNVAIGFSYSSLFNKNTRLISLLMGRMMQNISLCQKYKVKTIIGSFSENPYDLRSFYDITSLFTMFGMDSKNIKDSLVSNI